MQLKNSNYYETQSSNCDETQKLKFCRSPINQIVIKLKGSNCDETEKLKL